MFLHYVKCVAILRLSEFSTIEIVDYSLQIANIRSEFAKKRDAFDKSDRAFLAGKDSMKGKLLGMFSSAYYHREKLIDNADVVYGYAFRGYEAEGDREFSYPTWVLFSLSSKFDENPLLLAGAAKELLAYCERQTKRKKDKLYYATKDDWGEPKYVELPQELTHGSLIFLSMVTVRTGANPHFHLGLNLLLADKKSSKEVLYLPERYWSEDYRNSYSGKEKDNG